MMCLCVFFFFFKQKTAYDMRISDWNSDVCSSDLDARFFGLIQKDAKPDDCSEHQIRLDADRHGVVCTWSAQGELKGDYVRRAERIRGYASTGVHLSG